jgi:hypothetical protein
MGTLRWVSAIRDHRISSNLIALFTGVESAGKNGSIRFYLGLIGRFRINAGERKLFERVTRYGDPTR